MANIWETVAYFIFLCSKIPVDGDCSHEIKRHLLLARKVMTNLDSILKSRDITLSTKVRLVKALVFPVVRYGARAGMWKKLSSEELMLLNCGVGEDSWESLGLQGDPTSPFWWRSTLGFLWKEWCWSWNFSTLATSCEELTQWKTSDAGRDWGQEQKGTTVNEIAWWHHWLDGHDSVELWELVMDREARHAVIHGVAKSQTRMSNWTELNWTRAVGPQSL